MKKQRLELKGHESILKTKSKFSLARSLRSFRYSMYLCNKFKSYKLQKYSHKEEFYFKLEKINEPSVDFFKLFRKRRACLRTFTSRSSYQNTSSNSDSSKQESNRYSGISECSKKKKNSIQHSTPPNYNSISHLLNANGVLRKKKTFRCKPDFNKGLSCKINYLNYLNMQAREEEKLEKERNKTKGSKETIDCNGTSKKSENLIEKQQKLCASLNIKNEIKKNLSNEFQEAITSKEKQNLHSVGEKDCQETLRSVSCFKKYEKPISLSNLNSEMNRKNIFTERNNTKEMENKTDSFQNIAGIERLNVTLISTSSTPNIQIVPYVEKNDEKMKLSKSDSKSEHSEFEGNQPTPAKTLDNKEVNDLCQRSFKQVCTENKLKDTKNGLENALKSSEKTSIHLSQLKKFLKEAAEQKLTPACDDLEKLGASQQHIAPEEQKQQDHSFQKTKEITNRNVKRDFHLEFLKHQNNDWKNIVFEHWRETFGVEDFYKNLKKRLKHHSNHLSLRNPSCIEVSKGTLGSKTVLSMKVNRAKREVTHSSSSIRQYNSVGAFGYGIVLANSRIPENDFFKPDLRFRIRLRHSNIQSCDDASSCSRETAIKFADQNEDGPLDLILHTGRVAKADCCNSFLQVINVSQPKKLEQRCRKDPLFKFALVDGTRRAPDSYTSLKYYSHLTYCFFPSNSKPRLAKFRLIPVTKKESGLLDEKEQKRPWFRHRSENETKTKTYLREEFQKQMSSLEAVQYMLQMQMTRRTDEIYWNPQMIWDEKESPWLDLMKIQLTTTIPFATLSRTYFNIVDKPSCLKFKTSQSANEFSSFQNCLSGMYTRFELDHLQSIIWKRDDALNKENTSIKKIQYYVTLCTAPAKDTKSMVDVYITLIGTKGRTAPQKLDYVLEEKSEEEISTPSNDESCEYYVINTDYVGDILVISLTVRHRHLTDEWFLMYLLLSNPEKTIVRHFPCYNVVLSKVTLRPGEVSLPQKDCHELLRQERLLELRDKKSEYQWYASNDQPFGWIGAETVRDLPMSDRLQAEKYAGMPWDVDPTALETLLPFLAMAASRGLLPSIPLFHRQTSATSDNFLSIGSAHRKVRSRNLDTPASKNARRRWRKIRFAIAFITKVRIPDGPKGEMCRSVQDDVDFGRYFLLGPNPLLLKKVFNELPQNFPVNDETCTGYLPMNQTLKMAIDNGNVYIIDYSILSDIPTIQKKADKRYLTAPIILFYEREFGDLIPLAIQLSQHPSPTNPIWTPKDKPEDWIMAKLWVKCADYHYHLAISHLLKTHFLIEPFAVGMMRQLSSSHPVFKLLKPHFRYTLVTNTLLRRHILRRNCALDKYTSIGANGVNRLMMKYLREHFVWDELDPRHDMNSRGTLDKKCLPTYFYRDDATDLWDVIESFVNNMLNLFYKDNVDVEQDTELMSWVTDIYENGFPGLFDNLSGWNTTDSRSKRSNWHISSFDEDDDDNDESTRINDDESVFSGQNGSEVESKAEEESTPEPKSKVRLSVSFEAPIDDKSNTKNNLKSTQANEKDDTINSKTTNSLRSSNSHRSSATSYTSVAKSSYSKRSVINRPLEDLNLPQKMSSVKELTKLVTKLIFTATCQHSATHTEALDLYGFIPTVPSMMRTTPMYRKNMTSRDYIIQTLPDQFPDAYYGSLSTLLQVHKPEENSLGDSSEMHFVEYDAKLVTEKFQNDLRVLTGKIEERSRSTGIIYQNLTPTWIPNSVEPLPFLPKLAKEEAMTGKTSPNDASHIFMMTPSVPLSILPLCMHLAKSNPGKGGASKASRSTGFNSSVDGVGVMKKARDEKMSMQRQKFNNMF